MSTAQREKEHTELMEAINEVSAILNTGLDRQALSILVNLCEVGVNPEALASVVQELRKEALHTHQQLLQRRQTGADESRSMK